VHAIFNGSPVALAKKNIYIGDVQYRYILARLHPVYNAMSYLKKVLEFRIMYYKLVIRNLVTAYCYYLLRSRVHIHTTKSNWLRWAGARLSDRAKRRIWK